MSDLNDDRASQPELLAGRYRVGALLGRGGMAEVRDATDERLQRRVAIKFLLPALSADAGIRRRFELEARTAARIQHSNVVAVLDVGETAGGQPWIVMERLPGKTLRDEILSGPITESRARDVGLAILAALEAAHAAGVLHRDIKPANVLLDAGGRPKVADFGIAKSVGTTDLTQAATVTGTVLGTVAYLAPDRLHGAPATPGDDVWAVAVILYEALAGVKPFVGDTPAAMAASIAAGTARPLASHRPDVDPNLTAVIDRALSGAPQTRFATAAQMASALVHGEATVAATTVLATGAGAPTLPYAAAATSGGLASPGDESPSRVGKPRDHPRRWVPWIVVAGVAAVLGGLIWFGTSRSHSPPATTAPSVTATIPSTAPTTATTATTTPTSSSTTAQPTKPTKPPKHGK